MRDDHPTVLVVDDEPNVAEAYALWLSDEYDVLTAMDGDEALETLDDSVDVVLLDRRMPTLSGDEVLESIRDRGYDCRVALVTAVDPDFDVIEMPFDSYLTKPVTQDDLRTTVETLLTISEYDERTREQFSLAEKRAALEVEKSTDQLRNSEGYRDLVDRFETLRETTDETLRGMDHDAFSATFRDFPEDRDTSDS